MPGLFCLKREDTVHVHTRQRLVCSFTYFQKYFLIMTGFPTGFIYCFSSREQPAWGIHNRIPECFARASVIALCTRICIVCCAGMNNFSTKNRPVLNIATPNYNHIEQKQSIYYWYTLDCMDLNLQSTKGLI